MSEQRAALTDQAVDVLMTIHEAGALVADVPHVVAEELEEAELVTVLSSEQVLSNRLGQKMSRVRLSAGGMAVARNLPRRAPHLVRAARLRARAHREAVATAMMPPLSGYLADPNKN